MMLPSMGSPIDEYFKQRRLPLVSRDLSGRIKMQTLEDFEFNPGWRSPKQVAASMHLNELLYRSKWRLFSMRLNRYCRQGLLERRRRRRGYEYRINGKGEDRLLFFWKEFDYGLSRDSPNYHKQRLMMANIDAQIRERRFESQIRKIKQEENQS